MLYNNILIFCIFVLLFLIFGYPLLNESFVENNNSVENNSSLESNNSLENDNTINTMCLSIPSGECNSNLCPPQCRPKLNKVTNLCSCVIRIQD